jgi:hypothetical protein
MGLTLGQLIPKSDEFFVLISLGSTNLIGLLYMRPRFLQKVGLDP